MKFKLPSNLTRAFYKTGFTLKKHSPEILIVAGIAGTVTSAVMACKATTKLNDITEESKNQIDKIHEAMEHPETLSQEYTPEDGKKDLAIVYTQTAVKIAKLYGPSIILGALSLTAIISSNNILRKRNIAIATAYAAVDKSFKEYRSRVVERFGKEIDQELRYNVKSKTFDTVVVNEDGTETVVKETVNVADPNTYSEYAKFFDDGCKGWTKDPELNYAFLKNTMSYANDKLKTEGYLFLNDVYDMLGIPRTKAGQVVGWIYDEKHPNGDNFVDFGIYDTNREVVRNFINGYERTILLDFNVDGDILSNF